MCGVAVLRRLGDVDWGARLDAPLLVELAAIAAQSAQLHGDVPAVVSSAAGGPAIASPGVATDTTLSVREREVLERIAAGDSNKLIARLLDISPHTVKRHVGNILDKLGLVSRGQAAAWLREHA